MSRVKVFGRRLFAKATMGVPLVAKGFPMAPHLETQSDVYTGPGTFIGSGEEVETAAGTVRKLIWNTIRKDTKSDGERSSRRHSMRALMGGFDPDLAVLNSMSHVRRAQLQMDREREEQERSQSLRHKIIRGLGGNPEDYE